MIEPENRSQNNSELVELKEQFAALRSQATVLLLAIIVLASAFNVYLYLQTRLVRRDVEGIRPQATQAMELAKREDPTIKDFLTKLTEYGRMHPDFMPILNKYIKQLPAASASATTSAPPAATTPKSAAPAKQ